MKSTVPVGTGAVRHRLDERGLDRIGYVSNPEFTAEGGDPRLPAADRIVIGSFEDADGDAVEAPHRDRRPGRPLRRRLGRDDQARRERRADDAISFINEIANVCEATGADVVRVAEGVGLDKRIGASFLRAGIGYGGSCFPRTRSRSSSSRPTPATTFSS